MSAKAHCTQQYCQLTLTLPSENVAHNCQGHSLADVTTLIHQSSHSSRLKALSFIQTLTLLFSPTDRALSKKTSLSQGLLHNRSRHQSLGLQKESVSS